MAYVCTGAYAIHEVGHRIEIVFLNVELRAVCLTDLISDIGLSRPLRTVYYDKIVIVIGDVLPHIICQVLY